MDTSFDKPLACPILVGRASQVAGLIQVIAQAQSGHGQIVLLAGEAGMGKTRLVAEAQTRFLAGLAPAERSAPLVLIGRCFEPDRGVPYAPVLDLLRTFIRTVPPEARATALAPVAALGGLLPELQSLLPARPPGPPPEPEQEQYRIFQTLNQFLLDQTSTRPVLVVLEDLHWSDDTSLEWLLHLIHQIAHHPILLLGTYRPGEAQPALARLLAALDRARAATELVLAPFSPAEVDAMVRAIFGVARPVSGDFLATLYALTEGNPFFVEEVLKSLPAGDAIFAAGVGDGKLPQALQIPRTIQVTVQQRTERLSPAAQQLLVLSAVAGRRVDFTLLQRLTGHDESAVLGVLKELIAAQLVVEESEDVFAFRHALTQQAVYANLLARERRTLHGQVAERLEQLAAAAPAARLADLSYHYYAAARWDKAARYAIEAGEQAQALHAPAAAVEHFTRALAAQEHLAAPATADLYRGRGQAFEQVGNFAAAQADYTAALARARATHDQRAEWQSLLDLGWLWTGRDYGQAGGYFQEALVLARALADPAILAHTLNRVGNWYGHSDPAAGRHYHEEARALFQALGDRQNEAAALDLLGVSSYLSGDVPAGVAYYEQSVGIFRRLDDRQGLAASLMTLAGRGANYLSLTQVWPYVEAAACLAEAGEALRLARTIHWRAGEAEALAYLAHIQGPRGLFGAALRDGEAGLAFAAEIGHRQWMISAHLALGGTAYDMLAFAVAQQHFAQALRLAREINSEMMVQFSSNWLALAHLAQQDHAAARALLAMPPAGDPAARHLGRRYRQYALAHLALAEGDAAAALDLGEQLIATTAHIDYWGEGAAPHLWHLRGAALAARRQPDAAAAAWLAARRVAQILGLAPLAWRLTANLGYLYRAQHRRTEAATMFGEAWQMAGTLAAGLPDATERAEFEQRGGALLPSRHTPTPRRVAKQAFGGLTDRERAIAACIARGQSNRTIAATLILSERTVEKHVENILTKLDFQSRAQIAAWAVEKGLTD